MIYPEVENFEDILANLDFDPIYLDDFDVHLEEDKEMMKTLLYTRYGQNEVLTNIPSCVCKKLSGQENLNSRCTNCGTMCTPTYSRSIEPTLWSRVPDGVTAFINPLIWKMMFTLFKSKSNNILLWLTDPYYQAPDPDDPKMRRLNDLVQEIPNFKRGLNNFIENFDEVLGILLERKILGQKFIERSGFLEFKDKYRDAFFTTVLPVTNRNSFVIEQSGTANFTDTKALAGVDVFLTINHLHHSRLKTPVAKKESIITKCIMDLANHNEKHLTTRILPKPGEIRKHLVGSRLNFTSRAVITSLHGPHDYWEVELPWGIAVEQLKEHIRSKLLHEYDMTPDEIVDLLSSHVTRYHPLLDEVMNKLIKEAPYYTPEGKHKGIPIILNRNPTLNRG